jgi:hypothetical protein
VAFKNASDFRGVSAARVGPRGTAEWTKRQQPGIFFPAVVILLRRYWCEGLRRRRNRLCDEHRPYDLVIRLDDEDTFADNMLEQRVDIAAEHLAGV